MARALCSFFMILLLYWAVRPAQCAYAKLPNEPCSVQVNGLCYDDELEDGPVKIVHGDRPIPIRNGRPPQSSDQLQPKVSWDRGLTARLSSLLSMRLPSNTKPLIPSLNQLPGKAAHLQNHLMNSLSHLFSNFRGSTTNSTIPVTNQINPVIPAPMINPNLLLMQSLQNPFSLPSPSPLIFNPSTPIITYHPIAKKPLIKTVMPLPSTTTSTMKPFILSTVDYNGTTSSTTEESSVDNMNVLPLLLTQRVAQREMQTSGSSPQSYVAIKSMASVAPQKSALLIRQFLKNTIAKTPAFDNSLLLTDHDSLINITNTSKPIHEKREDGAYVKINDVQYGIPDNGIIIDNTNKTSLEEIASTAKIVKSDYQLNTLKNTSFFQGPISASLKNTLKNYASIKDEQKDVMKQSGSNYIINTNPGSSFFTDSSRHFHHEPHTFSHFHTDSYIGPPSYSPAYYAELARKYPLNKPVEIYTLPPPRDIHYSPSPTFQAIYAEQAKEKPKKSIIEFKKYLKNVKKAMKKEKRNWKKAEIEAYKIRKKFIEDHYKSNNPDEKAAAAQYALRRITLDLVGLAGYQAANYMGPFNTKYWIRLPNAELVKEIPENPPSIITNSEKIKDLADVPIHDNRPI